MFIARFTIGNSERFEQLDEQGNPTGVYNFIGTVLAGSYKSSIMNHNIFVDQQLQEGVNYLCDNVEAVKDGVTYHNVVVLERLNGLSEFLQAKELCGDIRNLIPKREVADAPPVNEFTKTSDDAEPYEFEEVAEEAEEVAKPKNKAKLPTA